MIDYCDGLADAPFSGVLRDDISPGIRTIGFRRRLVVAFAPSEKRVQILGVYYGGRDYETLLSTETS